MTILSMDMHAFQVCKAEPTLKQARRHAHLPFLHQEFLGIIGQFRRRLLRGQQLQQCLCCVQRQEKLPEWVILIAPENGADSFIASYCTNCTIGLGIVEVREMLLTEVNKPFGGFRKLFGIGPEHPMQFSEMTGQGPVGHA